MVAVREIDCYRGHFLSTLYRETNVNTSYMRIPYETPVY